MHVPFIKILPRQTFAPYGKLGIKVTQFSVLLELLLIALLVISQLPV